VFLFLSKTLDLLLAPLTWAILLGLGALLLRGRPRLSPALLACALAILTAFSLEPVSRRLFAALESRAAESFHPEHPYDAVILLGGMTDPAAARVSGELELTEAADRVVRTAALMRAGQARAVIISGGLIAPQPGEPTEAERLGALLREEGIAPDRIVLETRSRNTRENALESARLVAERGFSRLLLVTSAAHAPRALGCFRAVGLSPDVLPVDRRAGDGRGATYLPRASALADSTDALRELAGGLVYRLAGYAR
jgi:uncharacterized SAM-binding protein YcdF (DUF218 family)